jgi:hypothetical protein
MLILTDKAYHSWKIYYNTLNTTLQMQSECEKSSCLPLPGCLHTLISIMASLSALGIASLTGRTVPRLNVANFVTVKL